MDDIESDNGLSGAPNMDEIDQDVEMATTPILAGADSNESSGESSDDEPGARILAPDTDDEMEGAATAPKVSAGKRAAIEMESPASPQRKVCNNSSSLGTSLNV